MIKEKLFEGIGTEENPFLIKNEYQLRQVGNVCNLGEGYYFKQVNDIEITDTWESIGNEENPFIGHYDGNGKVISNLTDGLFGYIKDSEIKNVTLHNINIESDKNYVGGI